MISPPHPRNALRQPLRRPNMRRAVILFPSGLTLGNLFFGIFAIIAATRMEFTAAGVYVLLGGICDALDGRVARATNAGTEFGEELDSLVDAITFGLAPGMIMYFAVLNRDGWDWIWVFLFTACAVMRLARFNIEQAGTAKTYFQGLPSPAAGITLASYYWFSQSWLYNYGAIADLKWHVLMRYLMAVLSFLMISNIPYPTFPRTGFRSLRALGATLLLVGSLVLLATRKLEYFFPFALIYVTWGLLRWLLSGLFERRQPTIPYDLSEGEDDEEDEEETFDIAESRVHASRQGHREERASHAERPRARPERPVSPAPTERPERHERKATPPRASRTVDTDRDARQDRNKERPERPERSKRPDRAARPERPVSSPVTAAPAVPGPAVDVATGALPVGQPPSAGDDEAIPPGATAETELASADGTPSRRRKRRRRRGERKDRSQGDASTQTTGEAQAPDAAAGHEGSERSPYASPAAEGSPSPVANPAAPLPAASPLSRSSSDQPE
jgi:CDP-diacylglycerol--serine O-phosphatidyltransferase